MRERLPQGGLSPDALWQLGWELRGQGAWWMSGPLALALEQRYYAHLLGVTGEALLGNDVHAWWHHIGDMVTTWDQLWRLPDDDSFRKMVAVPDDLRTIYERAWHSWYAKTAKQLSSKENEERFKDIAPALRSAIRFLRDRQRNNDPAPIRACGYFHELYEINIGVKRFFAASKERSNEDSQRPRFASPLRLLYTGSLRRDRDLSSQLQRYFPAADRPHSATQTYSAGWEARDAGITWMSGLLALAMYDFEIECYSVITHVLKLAFPILYKESLRPDELRRLCLFAEWILPISAVSCIAGPMSRQLFELDDAVSDIFGARKFSAKIQDLHPVLFSGSAEGLRVRQLLAIPDTLAAFMRDLKPSEKHNRMIQDVPRELNAVIDLLQYGSSRDEYYRDKIRTEVFWEFKKYIRYAPKRAHRLGQSVG